MKKIWFVCSGVDIGHFWETKPFQTLREAKDYARTLPLTPEGQTRPFHIERWQYKNSKNCWNEAASSRIVVRNY